VWILLNYRTTHQIYADVLSVAKNTDRDGIAISALCHKSNISHGRLKGFVRNLTGAGLIDVRFGKNYVITEKGKTYLENYIKFHDLAESYGLEI
tara:strand:- start:1496 stop:1777 length:282 start_codon:yes stop_codon:yes gene_type:complete